MARGRDPRRRRRKKVTLVVGIRREEVEEGWRWSGGAFRPPVVEGSGVGIKQPHPAATICVGVGCVLYQ